MSRFIKTRKEIKSPKKMDAKKKKPSSNKIKNKVKHQRISGWDITMCEGGDCPFKDMCHRYTAEPDEIHQSYFTTPPYKINKGKPECTMFWGDAAHQLFVQLKEIMELPAPAKKKSKK